MADQIDIEGISLEVSWTPPAGEGAPVLVLLHEGLGSLSMWKDFPEQVRAACGAGMLVYSRYGYGNSTARRDLFEITYMHDEAQRFLPPLLEHFGIRRPVLVGHSDGASIALINAGSGLNPVRGVIVMAPHVFCEDISVRSIAAAKTAYETTDLKSRLARYHADPDSAFYGWNEAWLKPEFMDWNIEAFLPQISCPVLAIQGLSDEYGTLEQIDRLEGGVNGPFERLMLEDCGHSPHRDQPNAVIQAISRFVDSLD